MPAEFDVPADDVPPSRFFTLRRAVFALMLVGVLGFLVVVTPNLFLNLWLPSLINRQPERLRISFGSAWISLDGALTVTDLSIIAQGPLQQLVIEVDRADALVDFWTLPDHVFSASEIKASGGSFRFRVRRFPTEVQTAFDAPKPVARTEPDIPGLTNPADPSPEDIYPPPVRLWQVALTGIALEDMREVWLEDVRFVGDSSLAGDLSLAPAQHLELRNAAFSIRSGTVELGGVPVATAVQGRIDLNIAGMNPASDLGQRALAFVTAHLDVTADAKNLRFLDFYLAAVPWLKLEGGNGALDIDLTVEGGRLQNGSRLSADVQDLEARWIAHRVRGDGAVRFSVEPDDAGVPRSGLTVDFVDYAITRDNDGATLLTGSGLQVAAVSPHVDLAQPFSEVALRLELPEATVPDIGVYNAYLPPALGFGLSGGTAKLRAQLRVSTTDELASGDVYLDGDNVSTTLDRIRFNADFGLHGHLAAGDLARGSYDVSGSSLSIRKMHMVDGANRNVGASSGWWADLSVPDGRLSAQDATFLDARVAVKMRDTVPIITLFAATRPIPAWARSALGVRRVSGSARLRFAENTMSIPDFRVTAGNFEVKLRLRSSGSNVRSVLLVKNGALALGLRINGKEREVHPFGAVTWYAAQPTP